MRALYFFDFAHTNCMKVKKFLPLLLSLLLIFTIGCTIKETDDLQSLTHPYINQYTCQKATLDGANLLKNVEYLTVVLAEGGKADVLIKEKDKPKKKFSGKYTYDDQTQELCLDFGVFGYRLKQRTIVENGGFCINAQLENKVLFMQFVVG